MEGSMKDAEAEALKAAVTALRAEEADPPLFYNVSDETLEDMVARGLMVKTGPKTYLVLPHHDERPSTVHAAHVKAMMGTLAQFTDMAMLGKDHDD